MRPSRLASTTSSQTDIHCPSIALGECEDNADSQTLSPGNRTRSPWTMANRTVTASMWAAQMSRVAMGESDFDTGGELSDLEFLGMSAEEYEASAPVVAMNRGGGFVGFRSRSGVYTGAGGGNGMVGSVGGIGGSRRGDGNESDTSSWSL